MTDDAENGHLFAIASRIHEYITPASDAIILGKNASHLQGHLAGRGFTIITDPDVSHVQLIVDNGSLTRDKTSSIAYTALNCRSKCDILIYFNNTEGKYVRSLDTYVNIFLQNGWKAHSELTFAFRQGTGWDCAVLCPDKIEETILLNNKSLIDDPWLVALHETTKVEICVLMSSHEHMAAFKDAHKDLPVVIHSVEQNHLSRLERERIGILCGNSDYIFVCSDTTRISHNWFLTALRRLHNPKVGAVVSPVRLLGDGNILFEPENTPDMLNYWNQFPIMFRTVAYQQCQGQKWKFDHLKWEIGLVNEPLEIIERTIDLMKPRFTKEDSSGTVTIITAFDDTKVQIIKHYFEALSQLDYDPALISLVFLHDGRVHENEITTAIEDCSRLGISAYRGFSVIKTNTESFWLYMENPNYYKWNGVRYPISVRVSGLYNRATPFVDSEYVLFWESDTIPEDRKFLKTLFTNLELTDGAISGHYICREMDKSLAWDVTRLNPFAYEWVEPAKGVSHVGGVPHGLLLMHHWALKRFHFSFLACDPRDFRGPDLVMSRDLAAQHIPLKIHWDVICKHYNPDGTYVRP